MDELFAGAALERAHEQPPVPTHAQYGLKENRDCPFAHIASQVTTRGSASPGRGSAKAWSITERSSCPTSTSTETSRYTATSGARAFQVFVKIQSIELTPEKPRYEGSGWSLEGLLNEHIVATSVYFRDMENVVDTVLMSFRVLADQGSDDIALPGSEPSKRLVSTLAIDDITIGGRIPHTQELGSVSATEGKLIAFPNTLQTRMGPVELRDPLKPGHVRLLTLCLVDPNYRIVSTGRVPPQRLDWCLRDVFPWSFLARKGLPPEILYKIVEEASGNAISLRRAEESRACKLQERERMMAELNCED